LENYADPYGSASDCGSATLASAIPENQEEQHIQTIRNKQKVKTTSDLSESEGKILENSKWKIEDD
jgi:hypothetical protein